jgi:hypothetical protein
MATLTTMEMVFAATSAGLPQPWLMADIGQAESSGSTDVVNSIGCVGWLQINQPVQVKDHPKWTVAWLKDPFNNAVAAKVLWDADIKKGGDGTGPWVSSKSKWGSKKNYKDYKAGKSVTGSPLLNSINSVGDAVTAPLDAATSAVNTLGDGIATLAKGEVAVAKWLSNPSNWLRIGYVVGGLAIVAVVSVDLAKGSLDKTAIGKTVNGISGVVAKGATVAA